MSKEKRRRPQIPLLRIYLFGPLLIERGDKPIRISRRKVESLLAYLVLHPQEHPREQLAALFWGDFSDQQARASLRTSLNVLREQLGEESILADRDVVRLNPDFPIWVDVREFDKHAPSDPHNAAALYRGELLTEFYDDWVLPLREHYRQLDVDALLRWIQELRSKSEYAQAVEVAGRVLTADPANERAYQHLMFCHMALGDRTAAVETYEQCVEALEKELGVEPSTETQNLVRWIKQTGAESASPTARVTNLPIPVTSFIGRTRETAEVKELLGRARLVTLAGAGGSGKTRLSIQVGTDLLDRFKDGVWWVELGAIQDPGLVPKAVARALGTGEVANEPLLETLAHAIGSRHLLLILDNCEHLILASAQLAGALLQSCPHLKILATSREPLNIPGETVWHAPTLSVPAAMPTTLAEVLLSYEAIRLFTDRAGAARSDFALTDANAAAVVQICRRLDGIPLAIELAAARVRSLSPAEIAARLDDRFNLLTGGSRTALPRQQTLRALIDWSYNLLTESEQFLFRRLAVFASGVTLEAAQQVGGGEREARAQDKAVQIEERVRTADSPSSSVPAPRLSPLAHSAVPDLLARLVDKSLVIAQAQGESTRYFMLETIRDYALGKLAETGTPEWDMTHDRHLEYYLSLGERAEPQLAGIQQAEWMQVLEKEHDNIRAALTWAHGKERTESGLHLAASLWRFWKVRGHYYEGRRWFDLLLAQSGEANCANNPAICAKAFYAAGMLAYYQSDLATAAHLHQEGLAIRRELGDKTQIAESLAGLGLAVRLQGDNAHSKALFQESLRLARELNDLPGIAAALRYLGLVAIAQGDTAGAIEFYQEALPLTRQVGDEEALANLLNNLGIAETYRNNLERGEELTAESLAIRRRLNDPHGTALSLHTLSYYARMRKEWPRAKELLGEALGVYSSLGTRENSLECLESIAVIECEQGQNERAAQLYGACAHLRVLLHLPTHPNNQQVIESEVAVVRDRLKPDEFTHAWARGQQMSLEEAIAFAQASG